MTIHTNPRRDYLRRRAAWVWNEQGHAFKHGLCLQEETLTEILLLRMSRDQTKNGLKITMFNKREEGKNGADWEWVIDTGHCKISLRVQAKRLYHKSTGSDYGGLSKTTTQVDQLIRQSGDCFPVYVFYNHDHGCKSPLFAAGGEKPYIGRSFWGCTIASAQQVKLAKSNTLSDLKKYMRPWHHLFSKSGGCKLNRILKMSDAQFSRSKFQASLIVERLANTENMAQYILEHDLAGVALIDFSDFWDESVMQQ